MGGREVRRVTASAWNFGLFPNPAFAMRIIVSYFANTRRRHEEAWYWLEVSFRDLVRKDSGDDQTLNGLSLKGWERVLSCS
jgi:hypothetical protein